MNGDGHADVVVGAYSYNLLGRVYLATAATASAPFADPSLSAGVTTIRAVHTSELRDRINAVRVRFGLTPFAWTDPTLVAGQTSLRMVHIAELRTALQAAYAAAKRSPPVFSDPDLPPGRTVIKAAHIIELRNAVIILE